MTAIRSTMLVGETAGGLAALVRARKVRPVDIVRAHLERISGVDPQLRAFQQLREEATLAEAEHLGGCANLGGLPLAGVPVAIKDNVAVSGEPMRLGSIATPGTPSDVDHLAVQRLRAAGAIVLGTTCVSELCVWADCDSALATTRNPWNPDRTPGGSSGGSAAAVAGAMVPLALGADGMGSIRIPAACCGVVGLKPGSGVVPARLGVSAWHGMAENGPIATTVDDAAMMLSVLADRPEFRAPEAPGRPLRIAVSSRAPLPGVRVAAEIEAAVVHTGELLAAAGHRVERADPPAPSPRAVASILAHWFGGAAEDAQALQLRKLERRTRTHVRLGRLAQRFGLIRAEDRARWRALQERFFRQFDLLITAVLTAAPPSAGGWSGRSWTATMWAEARFAPFAAAWNFAGYPAAAVPAGVDSSGMPLSVQIVAPAGGEATLLSIAKQLEMLRPWRRHVLSAQ